MDRIDSIQAKMKETNYNLTFRNYGVVYNYEGHRLSYQNQGIDSKYGI